MNGTLLSCDKPVIRDGKPDPFTPCWVRYLIPGGTYRESTVAPTAAVTLNNAPSSLANLRSGDQIQLSGVPATSVVAVRNDETELAEEMRVELAQRKARRQDEARREVVWPAEQSEDDNKPGVAKGPHVTFAPPAPRGAKP